MEYVAADLSELANIALMAIHRAEFEQFEELEALRAAAEARRRREELVESDHSWAALAAFNLGFYEVRKARRKYREKEEQATEMANPDDIRKYTELKRALSELEQKMRPETVLISNKAITKWCGEFATHFFSEIRETICGNRIGAIATASELSAKGVATALAAWITAAAGMTSPVALGVAVMILLVISTAAKGAFCRMSRDEFVMRVAEKSG